VKIVSLRIQETTQGYTNFLSNQIRCFYQGKNNERLVLQAAHFSSIDDHGLLVKGRKER
jgi:hypothetical protein